jgi:hypothetical protein
MMVNILKILQLYYLFVLIFIGIGGSLHLLDNGLLYEKNKLKLIFMYQYAVYQLASEHLNAAGILILETITTFSVWFLNILILVVMCLWYILSAIWDLFYFCFKKR